MSLTICFLKFQIRFYSLRNRNLIILIQFTLPNSNSYSNILCLILPVLPSFCLTIPYLIFLIRATHCYFKQNLRFQHKFHPNPSCSPYWQIDIRRKTRGIDLTVPNTKGLGKRKASLFLYHYSTLEDRIKGKMRKWTLISKMPYHINQYLLLSIKY